MGSSPRILALVIALAVVHITCGNSGGSEEESIDIFKLINWDDLKTFQDAYSVLPVEIQEKLNKDILNDPSKLAKNVMSMLRPQIESVLAENLNGYNLGNLANLAAAFLNKNPELQSKQLLADDQENEIVEGEGEDGINKMERTSLKKNKKVSGFDFGPFGALLGDLFTHNPHMIVDIFQTVTKVNMDRMQGISVDAIFSLLTQRMDLDTIVTMLTSIRDTGRNSKTGQRFVDMLKLQEILQFLGDFAKSPTGKKVNRMMPRVFKAETLPDALRIVEKEMLNFRFDTILRQIQNPIMRQLIVSQAVRPVGEFLKGVHLPVSELKELVNDAEELLNDRMGLGEKTRGFVQPVIEVIRDKFKISKESLFDLKPKDFEKIVGDVLTKEVMEPMASVWGVYGHAKNHQECAPFVFCQLNKNFHGQNFIQRYVIKTSSVISAFQASATMDDRDAFSKLNQAIGHGGDGYDCTHGITSFCLDLMHTSAHNEL